MHLTDVWFLIIAVLWIGYFFLEGFDFGVGILTRLLARDERERRVLINTIGPVWDGNEVWLISAAGATFAAFPGWYATLFSGFYLPMLAILVALILRAVAFEYRGKRDYAAWRRRWDWAIFFGSVVPATLWGLIFGNIVAGVPIGRHHEYAGTLLDLLNPYAVLGGLVTLMLFTTHGAIFLALKTLGDVRLRARALARRCGLLTGVLALVFLVWTQLHSGSLGSLVALVLAVATLGAALACNQAGREGWAFLCSGVTVVVVVAMLFCSLYPAVLPSSTDAAWSLTVRNAASTPYTLKIMTWVAGFITPIVLCYQAWTYWVFRKRIGTQHIPPHPSESGGPDASGPSTPGPAGAGSDGNEAEGRSADTGELSPAPTPASDRKEVALPGHSTRRGQ